MEIRPVGAELGGRMDGQRHIKKLTVAFGNSANAPKHLSTIQRDHKKNEKRKSFRSCGMRRCHKG
jgi:hypothetical protein